MKKKTRVVSDTVHGDSEDASPMVTAGATANTTEGNSRASRESGLLCSHSHGESIDGHTSLSYWTPSWTRCSTRLALSVLLLLLLLLVVVVLLLLLLLWLIDKH